MKTNKGLLYEDFIELVKKGKVIKRADKKSYYNILKLLSFNRFNVTLCCLKYANKSIHKYIIDLNFAKIKSFKNKFDSAIIPIMSKGDKNNNNRYLLTLEEIIFIIKEYKPEFFVINNNHVITDNELLNHLTTIISVNDNDCLTTDYFNLSFNIKRTVKQTFVDKCIGKFINIINKVIN